MMAKMAAVAATLAVKSPLEAQVAKARPNILYALADDWGWPHASIAHDAVVKTPTFDRVCHEGVMFTNAFVAAPSCTPSRAAMLTGQWPWRLGEGTNLSSTLPVKYPVYPDLLEAAGYFVGYVGKGWDPGVVEAGGRKRNPAGDKYESIEAFFAARPEGKPFCLWFGSHDPHRPYKDEQYKGVIDPAKVVVPPYLPDSPEVRQDIADYYFAVERYDRDTGAILARLEKSGELDQTMVVMAGDNGWPFARAKAGIYDVGTHVPLAVRWKGHTRVGAVEEQFVSLEDIAPTFLEAASVKIPAEMTGRPWQPLLRSGAKQPGRDSVLTGMERHMGARGRVNPAGYPMRALRTKEWLYIRNFKPERYPAGDPACRPVTHEQLKTSTYSGYADIDAGLSKAYLVEHKDEVPVEPKFELATGRRPAQELYYMPEDPYQLKNLAGEAKYQAKLKQMDAELMRQLRLTDDPRLRGVELDRQPLRHTGNFEAERVKAFEDCPADPMVAPERK